MAAKPATRAKRTPLQTTLSSQQILDEMDAMIRKSGKERKKDGTPESSSPESFSQGWQ